MKILKFFLLVGIIFTLQNNCRSAEFCKIVGASTLASVFYNVVHDQITAHVCLPYFTQGFHKNLLESFKGPILGRCRSVSEQYPNSPTIQGLIWQPTKSWVGLPLGILIGAASRLGPWPKVGVNELIKPLAVTMGGVGLASLAGGIYGYISRRQWFEETKKRIKGLGITTFNQWPIRGVPISDGLRWEAVLSAKMAAYAAGKIGALGLAAYVLYKRIS